MSKEINCTYDHKDCFARGKKNPQKCTVLKSCDFKGDCPFYKTKEQFQKDFEIAEARKNNHKLKEGEK